MAESFFAKRENDRAAIRDPTKKPVIWAVLISFVHEAIGETIEVNAVEPINEYSKGLNFFVLRVERNFLKKLCHRVRVDLLGLSVI